MEATKYHHGLFLAAASLVLVLLQLTTTTAVFNENGSKKNSWPEFRGSDGVQAQLRLREDPDLGTGNHAYISRPSGEPLDLSGVGTNDDVWIYMDDSYNVYDTPKRGPWHPNRISPGWPELVGKPYKVAIERILQEVQGLKVVYGPVGLIRTQDFRVDRVFLYVDDQGFVAQKPAIG